MPQEEEILSTFPRPSWIPCRPHVAPTTIAAISGNHITFINTSQDSLENLEQSPGIYVSSEQPLIQVGSFLKVKYYVKLFCILQTCFCELGCRPVGVLKF